jgi:hypothetical protein
MSTQPSPELLASLAYAAKRTAQLRLRSVHPSFQYKDMVPQTSVYPFGVLLDFVPEGQNDRSRAVYCLGLVKKSPVPLGTVRSGGPHVAYHSAR